jgi:hypothetical protein
MPEEEARQAPGKHAAIGKPSATAYSELRLRASALCPVGTYNAPVDLCCDYRSLTTVSTAYIHAPVKIVLHDRNALHFSIAARPPHDPPSVYGHSVYSYRAKHTVQLLVSGPDMYAMRAGVHVTQVLLSPLPSTVCCAFCSRVWHQAQHGDPLMLEVFAMEPQCVECTW